MTRRLFKLAAAVALGLCAATIAAWLDSHFYTHGIWCSRPMWSVAALSKQGGFIVYGTGRVSRTGWIRVRERTDDVRWPLAYDELFDRHAFGFGYAAGKLTSTGPAYGFAVPYWLPAGLLAMATWRAWRGGRRSARGVCRVCGYDLRATPDRCPECGAEATTGATAA
jgi:hypothetical protein